MKKLWLALLLFSSFVLAQDSNTSDPSQNNSNDSKGQVTMRGCVSRSTGDYILMQQQPDKTYELQATGKTKLGKYLGQLVEVTGTKSPSLSTSSDALARTGSPAPTTITVTSIKTIATQCSSH
jgi:hypothetical protein